MLEDREFYLEHGRYNEKLSASIEEVAIEVAKLNFKNVFFAGAGGSISMLEPFVNIFKQLTDIPAYAEDAGEIAVSNYQQLNENSLVVVVSKTGTMKETVEVVEKCINENIPVVAFVGDKESTIAKKATFSIYQDESINSFRYLPLYYFFFKLLEEKGYFNEYELFKENMRVLPSVLYNIAEKYEPRAKQFSEEHSDDAFQVYIGSGLAHAEASRFSSCNMEEVFRIRTQVISSSEFFHGCFEIIDAETPAILIKGLDKSRSLDERVENFLKKYSGNYWIVDLADFDYSELDEQFVAYFTPIICSTLFGVRTFKNMEKVTGLSFNTRNYYNVVSY